jgi:hypothetical protein
MTLGNMRELGVRHLIGYCLNDACRHQALIDVSEYPGDVEVPWFSLAREMWPVREMRTLGGRATELERASCRRGCAEKGRQAQTVALIGLRVPARPSLSPSREAAFDLATNNQT